MRKFETPYLADWFATSLRWLILVGLSIWLSLRGLSNTLFLTLIVMLFWNIIMSLMAGLSMRLQRYHRQIVLAVDFILAVLLLFAQGGLENTTVWAVATPIGVGAIYFEIWGAFGVALLFGVLQAVISRATFSDVVASTGLAVTLAIGLISGLMGRLAMGRMRTSRQHSIAVNERERLMENERLRAIYELTSTLTATLNYKRVLDSALDLGYTALNPNLDPDEPKDERLVSAVLLFKGNELTIGSARRFTNADMRVNLRGDEGILKKIFDDGDSVLSPPIAWDHHAGHAPISCALLPAHPPYGSSLTLNPDTVWHFAPRSQPAVR